MVNVVVRSYLNFDGFECEGETYKLPEITKLKTRVAGREINWIKGKNTFTGKIISDKFFASMISLYEEVV